MHEQLWLESTLEVQMKKLNLGTTLFFIAATFFSFAGTANAKSYVNLLDYEWINVSGAYNTNSDEYYRKVCADKIAVTSSTPPAMHRAFNSVNVLNTVKTYPDNQGRNYLYTVRHITCGVTFINDSTDCASGINVYGPQEIRSESITSRSDCETVTTKYICSNANWVETGSTTRRISGCMPR